MRVDDWSMRPKLPPCYCGCSEREIESLEQSFGIINVSKDSMKDSSVHKCSQSGPTTHGISRGRVTKHQQPCSIVSTFSSSRLNYQYSADYKDAHDMSPCSTNSAHSFVVDSASSYTELESSPTISSQDTTKDVKRPKSLRTRMVGISAPAPTPVSPQSCCEPTTTVNAFSSSEETKGEEANFPRRFTRRRRNAVCEASALGRNLREYLMSYMLSSVTDQIESSLNLTHSGSQD